MIVVTVLLVAGIACFVVHKRKRGRLHDVYPREQHDTSLIHSLYSLISS